MGAVRRTIEWRGYDCCALVIQDRVELNSKEKIATIKQAALDHE